MRGEGYRPFQPQVVVIPLEKVGVRGSERRPGERRLNLVRPLEPEQPKTLLQEMQQYMTTRQSLREEGSLQRLVEQSYLQFVGRFPQWLKPNIDDAYRPLREKAPISLADATHNDLYAIGIDDILPDNARAVMTKGNTARMQEVFDAYGMSKFSSEKQHEILASDERVHEIDRQSTSRIGVIKLTPAETETVQWLLARICVPFDAPPEGFSESDASLLLRMRTAVAHHQPMWEQKTLEERYRASRRG